MFWIVVKRAAVDAQKNVSWLPNATVMYRPPNQLCPVLVELEHRQVSSATAAGELVEHEAMRRRQRNHFETPTR